MQDDPQDSMLSGILDTPTVWLQVDAGGVGGLQLPRKASQRLSGPMAAGRIGATERLPSLPLTARLRQALKTGAFSLAYQPVIDARTRRLRGGEALLRWSDPLCEADSPAEFIPTLERTGLIVAVGEWVLRQSCLQMKSLCTDAEPIVVGVNLSPRQLAQPGFVARLAGILEETGLPASQLELEVTESVLEDMDRACRSLHELRELGIGVLIDDFGMGYSSLSRLKKLPVSGLKLDRSFVSGIFASRRDRLVTQSIIRLARKLQLEVTAEGVEDLAHETWLRDQGVSRLQGFLYSPGVSALQFNALFEDQPFARPATEEAPAAVGPEKAG